MPETLLDRLLLPGAFRVVFQPILSYDQRGWQIHALEALVRGPRGTHMEYPEVLFEYVRRKSAEAVVDRHCVAEVMKAARPLGSQITLSINVHAATLEQDALVIGDVKLRDRSGCKPPPQLRVPIFGEGKKRLGDLELLSRAHPTPVGPRCR